MNWQRMYQLQQEAVLYRKAYLFSMIACIILGAALVLTLRTKLGSAGADRTIARPAPLLVDGKYRVVQDIQASIVE